MNKTLCLFLGVFVVLFCAGFQLQQPRLNVLLISVDTLRADALGCYGSTQKTPAMDSLASRSVLFENTISQVPLTLPSHATIFTGLFPQQHGIRNNEIFMLSQKIQTLAEVFQQNGYSTGAVVGSFALDSGFGINQGFKTYDDEVESGNDSGNRFAERRAESVWKRGKQWIEVQKGPWFCFLHFYDPHTGYSPPKPYPQSYAGEVSYIDAVIQQILGFVENSSLNSTTIVVLLSDHGESLGEHGEASHGVFLYDSTLKVPLLIAAPGFQPLRVKSTVRLADIGPTILELAQLPPFESKTSPAGTSLVTLMKGQSKDLPAYSESFYTNLLMGWAPLKSIRSGQFKWIDAPRSELYNLSSDPEETHNLYSAGGVPPSLRRDMERFSASPTVEQPEAPTDPELKERLASLGYVTGSSAVPSGNANFDPKDGIKTWTTIEAAVTSAQTGKLQEAEAAMKRALKEQPDNVIAQKFLANILSKQGKEEEAILYLKKALSSPLHEEETRVDLAKVLYARKGYEEVVETLLPVVGKPTQNAVALKLAGLSSAHIKEYETASDFLQRALDIYPKDPESLSTLAGILSHSNRDKDALEKYQLLETVRPLTEQEAVETAAIYITEKHFLKAETYFQKALQANSESGQAWRGLALIFASRNQWSQAVDAFVKAKDCDGARTIISKRNDLPANVKTEFERNCSTKN